MNLKAMLFLPVAFCAALPLAAAQDNALAGKDPTADADRFRAGPELPSTLDRDLPMVSLPSRGLGGDLLQEEIVPRLRLALSLYGRVDFPGDTDVSADGTVGYSDIFDIGYGVNAELSLMSELTPRFSMGGYLSVGWDRFQGASNVDMGTGEFFTFHNQDVTTFILGGKVLERFGPAFFWEGRMGVGLVHYGSLGFTDVTGIPASGLQFFRPVTHGLFDLGGRVGFGTPHVTFDLGIDFRFMGSQAAGRDVNHDVVDPQFFFVFAIDLGVTFRF
jgi:hypothetical protein